MTEIEAVIGRQEAMRTNAKFYIGGICVNGNTALRFTKSSACTCEPCRRTVSLKAKAKNNGHAIYMRSKEYLSAKRKLERKQNPIKVREYFRKNAASRSVQIRDRRYAHMYRMQPGEYDKFFEIQAGRCALCEEQPKRLFIDHCHATGRIRGLLCNRCNIALGFMEKYRDKIGRMLTYSDKADIRQSQRDALLSIVEGDRK